MNIKNLFAVILLLLFPLFLSNCSVKPDPLTTDEIDKRAKSDYSSLFPTHTVIDHPISLYEAMARALKFNLDHRLKMMETVVSNRNLKVENLSMLPDLVASAGYFGRNEYHASSSFDVVNNVPQNTNSASQERDHITADIKFTWNILDFGISYLNAHQAANQVLITVERQRKIVHNIIRDVRYAYWRMVSSQRLQKKIDPLMGEIRRTLKTTKALQKEGLKSPREILEFERSLWDILRQMTVLQRDLYEAKIELASLIGIEPGSDYSVMDDSSYSDPLPSDFTYDVDILKQAALRLRPELLEEDYRERISLDDVEKARWEMFPSPILEASYNYDDNRFLLHQHWAEYSARLVFNIINWIAGYSKIDLEKSEVDLGKVRRKALSVAVLTQVEIAYLRYNQLENELHINKQLKKADSGIYLQILEEFKAEKGDELELIRAKANVILSQLRYDLTYADWQNAAGQLLNSVGFDPVPSIDANQGIEYISQQLEEMDRTYSIRSFEHYKNNVINKEVTYEGDAPSDSVGQYPGYRKNTKAVVGNKDKANNKVQRQNVSQLDGPFSIQLGAFKKFDVALQKKEQISDRHSDLLDSLDLVVIKADLGSRGTFYRIRSEQTFSKEYMKDLCSSLSEQSQACIITR